MSEFKFELSDGRSLVVPLEGLGGEFRFGVGTPGVEESGVWRVWSNKTQGDVYLATRRLAGVMKVSLHTSGIWKFQWTQQSWDTGIVNYYSPTAAHRTIQTWRRPEPLGAGWTRAITVWFAADDVTPVSGIEHGPKEIYWEPKSAPGTALGFHVMLGRPDQGTFVLKGFKPLAAWDLVTGETVLILVSKLTLTDEQRRDLARDKAIALSGGPIERLTAAERPRGYLFGFNEFGFPMFWDFSAELDRVTGPAVAQQTDQ